MSESDLKPCPFCGTESLNIESLRVWCPNCCASGPHTEYPETAWNRRACGWEDLRCARCGKDVPGVKVPKDNPNLEVCVSCCVSVCGPPEVGGE